MGNLPDLKQNYRITPFKNGYLETWIKGFRFLLPCISIFNAKYILGYISMSITAIIKITVHAALLIPLINFEIYTPFASLKGVQGLSSYNMHIPADKFILIF